jgi:hypothetical protein
MYLLASSLAAAALDGLFEPPAAYLFSSIPSAGSYFVVQN